VSGRKLIGSGRTRKYRTLWVSGPYRPHAVCRCSAAISYISRTYSLLDTLMSCAKRLRWSRWRLWGKLVWHSEPCIRRGPAYTERRTFKREDMSIGGRGNPESIDTFRAHLIPLRYSYSIYHSYFRELLFKYFKLLALVNLIDWLTFIDFWLCQYFPSHGIPKVNASPLYLFCNSITSIATLLHVRPIYIAITELKYTDLRTASRVQCSAVVAMWTRLFFFVLWLTWCHLYRLTIICRDSSWLAESHAWELCCSTVVKNKDFLIKNH